MHRSLVALTVFLVTALGGTAEARRLVCEREPELSVLDTAARAEDDSAPRIPIEHSVCVAGMSGDPSCWDHQALPEPGRGLLLGFSEGFLHGSRAPFLAPPCPRSLRIAAATRPLAEGHARRLERPPRATAS
jgi:hypothetical protein